MTTEGHIQRTHALGLYFIHDSGLAGWLWSDCSANYALPSTGQADHTHSHRQTQTHIDLLYLFTRAFLPSCVSVDKSFPSFFLSSFSLFFFHLVSTTLHSIHHPPTHPLIPNTKPHSKQPPEKLTMGMTVLFRTSQSKEIPSYRERTWCTNSTCSLSSSWIYRFFLTATVLLTHCSIKLSRPPVSRLCSVVCGKKNTKCTAQQPCGDDGDMKFTLWTVS